MVEAISGERTADLLKGWNFAPRLVGIFRGALEAAVLAALAVLGANLDEIVSFLPALPEFSGAEISTGSIGWFVIRWLESEADQKIDPQQNRTAEARAANPPQ